MGCKILFDGNDVEAIYGVMLEDGGLDVFEIPPVPKEPFYNEWADQHGREYDDSAPVVYQTQTFDVPFLMVVDDMEDYRSKKAAFMNLLNTHNEFDIQLLDYGEAFRVRFKQVVSWQFIQAGIFTKTSARFVLKLECNHNKGYIFKYLADNEGRYIVINDDQKILVKTSL